MWGKCGPSDDLGYVVSQPVRASRQLFSPTPKTHLEDEDQEAREDRGLEGRLQAEEVHAVAAELPHHRANQLELGLIGQDAYVLDRLSWLAGWGH